MRSNLQQAGHDVVAPSRQQCDLAASDSAARIWALLDQYRPGVIVNCAGVYDPGLAQDQDPVMRVNFGSNWNIVNRVALDPWPVRIVMIGSSAYSAGRPRHLLYAASKAALHNLWSGARDLFESGPARIDIVHPVRVRTKMIQNQFDLSLDWLEPDQVAAEVHRLIQEDQGSRCIEITFEENK